MGASFRIFAKAGISAEWKDAKQRELPLRRFEMPEEVAPSAVFLGSGPDGNFYKGQTPDPNSGDALIAPPASAPLS